MWQIDQLTKTQAQNDEEKKQREVFNQKYKEKLGDAIQPSLIHYKGLSLDDIKKHLAIKEKDYGIEYLLWNENTEIMDKLLSMIKPNPTTSKELEGSITKQVLFTQKNNGDPTKRNGAHIGCYVIFKEGENCVFIVPRFDDVYGGPGEWCSQNTKMYIRTVQIQADAGSCGVVAYKMAKHLTIDWYKANKDNLLDRKKLHHPVDNMPEKLLAYKQTDIYKIEKDNPFIFEKLFKKGYIKHIIKGTIGQIRNTHMQEVKSRMFYPNFYHNNKDNIPYAKNTNEYIQEKNKIVKQIEEKYINNEEDDEKYNNNKQNLTNIHNAPQSQIDHS